MIGPITVRGGISFVANEYMKAGLDEKVHLTRISTLRDGSVLGKVATYALALPPYTWSLISKRDPVVHLHLSQDGSFFRKLIAFTLAKIFRRKTLVHLHGSQFEEFMFRHGFVTRLVRYMFDNASVVVVLSDLWRDKLGDFSTNPNIVTLYNPIASSEPRIGSGEGSLTVLFLGRLGERKGIYDLLQCVEDRQEYFRDQKVRFILAGDGDVDRVRELVATNGWQDLVEVPGWISGEQKERLLKSSDLLVLPSYNEQMPMSILEGMSYSYPVVASNVAGIPEMVEDGRNGFLLEPGDTEGLSKALMALTEDQELRETMGNESRKLVDEKFDGHVVVDKLVEIYRSLYD